MINFTDKHFFGPKGEVHLIHDKMDLHTDYVFQNPKLFGFKSIEHADSLSNDQFWNHIVKNGFIRGEYFQNYDNTHNHNLTYEASQGATPSKFVKALETLHRHYSKKPNTEFRIGVFAGSNMKEDNSLRETLSKITGGDYELSTLDHIKQMIDLGKGNKENPPVRPVKKISRREIEQKINTGLGKEIRMGRGDMTTAEWNFWRRKGLGDSYNPLYSFKKYISERRYQDDPNWPPGEQPDFPMEDDTQEYSPIPPYRPQGWGPHGPAWIPVRPGSNPLFPKPGPSNINPPPGINIIQYLQYLANQYFLEHGFWPSWWPYPDAGPYPEQWIWDPRYFPEWG